jgi:hypothetical protein
MSCTPGTLDPYGNLWVFGVSELGQITLTNTGTRPIFFEPLYLDINGKEAWKLTADAEGRIVSQRVPFVAPTLRGIINYMALQSPSGMSWKLEISNAGAIFTTFHSTPVEDFIPSIPDVTMSRWPVNIGVVCQRCNNATVHVSADLSCWCCSCNTFVPDDETNEIVILEE